MSNAAYWVCVYICTYVPSDLFLDDLSVGLGKEREEGTGEVVGVAVGIAELVCYGVQEQVAT